MSPAKARRYRVSDLPEEALGPGLSRRLITGERAMLAHVYLKKGTVVPKHSHDNEQITYILEGALRFWLGDDGAEQVDVGAGEALLLPSGLPHRAEALADTVDVDIFAPPRKDWLDGTDSYLRGDPAGSAGEAASKADQDAGGSATGRRPEDA